MDEIYPQNAENTPNGHVLIFAGPHGAGKDTLEAQFTQHQPNASRIVRHITREPAPTETDGQDYYFVSEEHFLDMVARDAFVEHARYIGMMSGTSYAEFDDKLERSRYASLSANFKDGLSLHRKLGEQGLSSVCFFISPVSEAVLHDDSAAYLDSVRARMERRGRSSDLIEGRLVQAANYRELYLANQDEAVYVENSDGRLEEAGRRIAQTALSLTIATD
jgi:guanylate kinase